MSSFGTDRRRRNLHTEVVKSALGAGWPALLLAVGALAAFLWQISMEPEGARTYGVAGFGLSRDALVDGRWWTLLTHVLIQDHFVGQVISVGIFGWWAWKAADGGETGPEPLGWRFLAVFFICSFVGAAAHLAAAPGGLVLTGVWPGLLGLIAFRSGGARDAVDAGEGPQPKGMSDARSRREVAAALAAMPVAIVFLQAGGEFLDWTFGPLLLLGLAGGAIAFGVDAYGPRWLNFLLKGAVLVLLVLVVSDSASSWSWDVAKDLPIMALAAGWMTGLALGMFGRRSAVDDPA